MALPGAPAPSPVAAGPQAAAPLPPSPSPSSPPTVLMAVRAGLAEPSRLPSLPAASSLRLQLSVQPGTGGRRRFRLGLRGTEAPGGENLIEFNLSDISYRVRSPTCHELRVPTSPEDPVILNFEEEREAQKWWTILSSSLREAQKASETSPAPQASSPPPSSASDPHPEADPASELAEKEDLALQLCEAIECGDEDLAARSAVALARQQAPLRILWRESTYPPDSICMKVGVEDSTSSANITIQVQAHTTIEELKQQIFQDYGFHPLLQRWIIGQCLCVDERTVASYGIRRDGDVAFLYLLSAKAAHLTRQRYEEDQARLLLGSVSSFSSDLGEQSRKYNTCPSRTSSKPAFGNEAGRRLDLAETNQALDSLQLRDLGSPPAAPDPPSPAQGMSPPGDQPQRGAAGGLSLPRRVLRLREPPPGTRDPGAGVPGRVPALPGEEPGPGREEKPQQLPLPDARLPRLVLLRGLGQRVPVSHLPGPQLPPLQGHPRGPELPPVPGRSPSSSPGRRGRSANQRHAADPGAARGRHALPRLCRGGAEAGRVRLAALPPLPNRDLLGHQRAPVGTRGPG
ncbi:sharpin-like isoform X2 [Phaenicophaeus curvirostris]|uniref:sharpin-like isoform X2 n=1 Tax=Phaenicophaeus curvirostris TaxID=33595 RepID=UPI0037F0ABBB